MKLPECGSTLSFEAWAVDNQDFARQFQALLIRKADQTHPKGSMHILKICVTNCTPTKNVVGNVLRAGCDSPPAVMARNASSPRALVQVFDVSGQGQQTRCDPGADGHSPDEERTGLVSQDRLAASSRVPLARTADDRTLASPSIQSALFVH
jgi:hypothetical protein